MAGRNNGLRSTRDLRNRKKLDESSTWEKKMLESLKQLGEHKTEKGETENGKSND